MPGSDFGWSKWPGQAPRVVPLWFHRDGEKLVIGTPPGSPKIGSLQRQPAVALTIDNNTWPYKLLFIRGTATVEQLAGMLPEYALAAERHVGEEGGRAWIAQMAGVPPVLPAKTGGALTVVALGLLPAPSTTATPPRPYPTA